MLGTTKETKGLGAWSRSLVGLGLALCAVGMFVLVGCQAQPKPPAPAPSCDTDADCSAGQICENEVCVAAECTEDADCAEGDVCEDGRCVEGPECVTDADCEADEECVNGECVAVTPPECETDADCLVTEECVDGECVAIACEDDADCDDGLYCNGAEVCTNGACVAGTDPCAAGEECDEDTDTCAPPVETFTLTAPTVTDEGDSGTTNFEFVLSRAGGDGAAKTLDWEVTSAGGVGTASVDDFVGGAFPSGTVDFAEGDFADKTITVEVQGDTSVEDDEVFTLTVSELATEVAGVDATITNDDATADPVVTLPTDAGATVGQNSLITGISVSDADNTTLTVNIVTGDGFMSFAFAPACTAVDGDGNAVVAANVLKDEYTLTGTIDTINQTLAGFQFTSDRSTANPGTDQCMFTATDADGGEGTGTLDIAVGILFTLTAGDDTGANFTGTAGGDVFLDAGPGNFGQGDQLVGGAGPDMIEIQLAGAATYPNADTLNFSATGIETLWVNGTTAGPVVLDNFRGAPADIPDLDTIVYSPSGAHALTVTDAPDALTLIVDTRNGAFAAAVDVSIYNALLLPAANFMLEMRGQSAAGTPLTVASVASTGGSIETLNINSVSQNGTTCTNTITGPSTITVDTVTITGDQDLVAGAWTGANTDNIDASGFEGDLTVTSAIAGAVINGGLGNDNLTGGAGVQVLVGDDGTDVLTGGAGADQLTGGAGADTFVMVVADVPDTIIDFTPGADDFDWNTALLSIDGTVTTPGAANAFQSAAAGTAILGPTTVFELTGTTVAAPYAAANVVAALGATATNALIAVGDSFLFVVYYDDGRAAIWAATASGAGAIIAADLTLAAELSAPITADSLDAGDFI